MNRILKLEMEKLGATTYSGKSGDVFKFPNGKMALVRSNRISAFDQMLPREIPNKGHILNMISNWMVEKVADGVCPYWAEVVPNMLVTVGNTCEPILVEMVVRGYNTGSLWRNIYSKGSREICGVELPEGMNEYEAFPRPIITPTTKSEKDENITPEEIVKSGLCTQGQYDLMSKYSLELFARGQEYAKTRGLILVDTKYEFGLLNGVVTLIDEVHTPDSSRYWYLEGHEERQSRGEKPKELSKEFVRQWLISEGFQGRPGEQMPEMSDEKVEEIRLRYVGLYEILLGHGYARYAYEQREDEEALKIVEAVRPYVT